MFFLCVYLCEFGVEWIRRSGACERRSGRYHMHDMGHGRELEAYMATWMIWSYARAGTRHITTRRRAVEFPWPGDDRDDSERGEENY